MHIQSKKHTKIHNRNLPRLAIIVSEIWKHPVCWASHTVVMGIHVMFLQAPIPGIVLSYRLSRSLRGWSPAHHGLSASASDGSLSHPQPQEQPQQPQQQPLPDSEYGAIAKFAGSQVRRTSTRSATPDLVLVRRSGGALVSIDREFVTSAKKIREF